MSITIVNDWQAAVEHEVVLTCCGPADFNDPKAMVKHIIDWNVAVALDPKVSEQAAALVEAGRQEVRAEMARLLVKRLADDAYSYAKKIEAAIKAKR